MFYGAMFEIDLNNAVWRYVEYLTQRCVVVVISRASVVIALAALTPFTHLQPFSRMEGDH